MNILRLRREFDENGFVKVLIPDILEHVGRVRTHFCALYQSRFDKDHNRNRELIKSFARDPLVGQIFCSPKLLKMIHSVCSLKVPVFCGPTVSHYTSNDLTGKSFGIPLHQDYPSMASSRNSIICWISLNESGENYHGIEILKESHKQGVLDGVQTESGYHLKQNSLDMSKIVNPNVMAGELLLISSHTPHRTYVNPNFDGWKLSISQRFDDLEDPLWLQNGFRTAYATHVNRDLFYEIKQ
jgi:hypothetical protein